jgi:hypothetical protein
MSAGSRPPTSDGANEPLAVDAPSLDLSKLKSLTPEHQDLYILQFVTSLSTHTKDLDADGCTAQQAHIKTECLQVGSLAKPAPSRVVRNSLGRCLATIFGKGDRKLLFETINELIGILGTGKGKTEAELRTKHAAAHCLGEVYGAAGDSAIGLHPLACTTLLKLFKQSTSHAGLRASIFKALAKIYTCLGSSADETIARDVWKQARSHASSDKAHVVQIASCRCMEALVTDTPFFNYPGDYESLKSTVLKTIDSQAAVVRQAAASALAAALVKSHSTETVQDADIPQLGKIKRTNTVKRQSMSLDGEDGQASRSESPAPKKSQILQFTLLDLLRQLSTQYVRTSTTNRMRAALAVCYCKIVKALPKKTIEAHYLRIVDHLTTDLLSNPNVTNNRYRLLMTRRFVQIVLEDIIGQQILGEAGQLDAAKQLINDVIKNFPQVLKERPEPTKYALVAVMSALGSLISTLGSAATSIQELCREGLLQVIQHPSYTVQLYTAQCLRQFTLACPQQLLPCLSICMNSLNREISLLTAQNGRGSHRRCVGYANSVSALISTSPKQPLYGSVDVYARVFTLATNLLKSSGKQDLRISATQIQVSWILIGGLMALGPNFVKIHLSQLLQLWKNALPKPLPKDNTTSRSLLEYSFLTHVRECALGSILSFLQFNSRLVTTDVSKRIAAMLQNTTAFLKGLPSKTTSEDPMQRLFQSLQLHDHDLMTQRRVLQCYVNLVNSSTSGSEALLQSNLLTLAVSFFSDPDNYTPSSLSTSIANSAGTFDSIWDIGDNCGFGVTGLVNGFNVKKLQGEHTKEMQHEWTAEQGPEASIDAVLLSPIRPSLEHDSLALYVNSVGGTKNFPDPPATEVVNVAIRLFAVAFPLTPPKIQESILEQITTFLSASSLQRDPGRKAAMNVNVATALLTAMKVAVRETASPAGELSSTAVQKLLADLLRNFSMQSDQYIRTIGFEALARLCNAAGNAFTNAEIKWLVDTIVAIREPDVRAGCAMALGSIHAQVGGMAAGLHLKTIIGILMSLCNDPNPTVHFWSLEALARVADSAGLTFSAFVSSTLGILGQLYASDTHNASQASTANSNLELELPTPAVVARCVDSLVNVLGPDLQDMTKARELIFTLVAQFRDESSTLILGESLRCFEHLSLYAPGHVDFGAYVKLLQKDLKSDIAELRDTAIDGLYNLMKRNAEEVIRAADPGFEDDLWLALDVVPEHEGLKNIIRNWLQQSGLADAARWIQRLQNVLVMTKSTDDEVVTTAKKGNPIDLRDEEVAGFAAASGVHTDDAAPAAQGKEQLRWQVRTFAMSLLADLFHIILKDVSVNGSSDGQAVLQRKLADIIRMAFSASTANILQLRIWGLKIIDMVLKMFGNTPDPDFPEAPLLEQYQAQIGSALTPAFAGDSSPELASEAVNVCAAFIATGIVTDVDRMGRILKTLVTALENFSTDAETASIGDLKDLSANAQVMVKMAVFSAWAELQVASTEQKYLVDVMAPYIAKLTPLWLASLQEFARLRFEPEISMSLGPPNLNGSLDDIYSALNRETLLGFYQESWLKLVDAIASLIEQDSEFVFDALDGKDAEATNGNVVVSKADRNINYRDEPVAFFFVLFGIAFEALVSNPAGDVATKEQTLEILTALKRILHPSVSGNAIYKDAIFSETMDLLGRLVLTEGMDIRSVIVQIARALCVSHPSATGANVANGEGGEDLSEDIEQLFELTRIIVLVLCGLIPNLSDQPIQSSRIGAGFTDEAVGLIQVGLEALVDAAEVFPAIIKTDLHACIIHIFATILGTPSCQVVVVPSSLPTLKRFVISISGPKGGVADDASMAQLGGCLRRILAIYAEAQKREHETSLSCVKNTLLACTIVLTSGTNGLGAENPVVARYLDEVVDCMSDRMVSKPPPARRRIECKANFNQTAKVAAGCIRSLLLHNPKSSADESIARYLLPRLIAYVSNTSAPDPEKARSIIATALTAFASQLPAERKQAGYALVIPTLLHRAENEEYDGVLPETNARLLEMAAADADAFRSVVGGMSSGQRSVLEEVLKSGQQRGPVVRQDSEGSGEPTISLKMNFGA